MPLYHAEFFCKQAIQITGQNSKSPVDEILSGFDSSIAYMGCLLFDIDSLPAEAEILIADMRVHLRHAKMHTKTTALLISPLPCPYNGSCTSAQTLIASECAIPVSVANGCSGFLDVNITELFCCWKNGIYKNSGVVCRTCGDASCLITIDSSPAQKLLYLPCIRVAYRCPLLEKQRCPVHVRELSWHLNFESAAETPIVPASKIKVGTFFVTNLGSSAMTARLETGADNCHFVLDNEVTVLPKETTALIGKYYGKFYRLRLLTPGLGCAEVKFISQNYM